MPISQYHNKYCTRQTAGYTSQCRRKSSPLQNLFLGLDEYKNTIYRFTS